MKPDYKQISEFIRNSLDREYLAECSGIDIQTDQDAFEALKAVYHSEHGYAVRRCKNYQQCFASWLMGLPTAVSIPYANYEILQLAVKWGSLPADATEKQEDKILDNYWSFMAMQYHKEARKHKVDLFRG